MSRSRSTKGLDPARVPPERQRYIIRMRFRGAPSLPEAQERLHGTGIELDPRYGPIVVDPSRNLYVLRGWATPDAKRRAEKQGEVDFFADPQIEPTSVNR